MNSFNKLILLIGTFVLTACAKDEIDISTIPESDSIHANIDTITIISDALVLIELKNNYYSANASYIADSLILLGAKQALIKKGYTAGTMRPLLMGSFMSTNIDVPVKPRNLHEIKPAALPYVFANQTSQNQINALKNINRKLYLSLMLSQYVNMNEIFATDRMKTDLDTISKLIKGQYALFIFHQAKLINQELMGAIGFATYLIGGLPAAIASTPRHKFHTYYILVNVLNGNIVWCDYSIVSLFPSDPVFESGQHNSTDITEFIDGDSLYNSIIDSWLKYRLSEFPERTSSGYIEKNSQTYSYPTQDFFGNKYLKLTDYPLIGKNRIKTIDSLIIALSISDNIRNWKDPDIITNSEGNGRPDYAIESELELLDSCLLYAYRCRLKINPAVKGEFKLGFSIAKDGKTGNTQVLESTLNDPVLEYAAAYIIKLIRFKSVRTWPGTTRVVHEISFQEPHW